MKTEEEKDIKVENNPLSMRIFKRGPGFLGLKKSESDFIGNIFLTSVLIYFAWELLKSNVDGAFKLFGTFSIFAAWYLLVVEG